MTQETTKRMRLPLKTANDISRELARLYRDAKSGRRSVDEVSKMANVLATLLRGIEEKSGFAPLPLQPETDETALLTCKDLQRELGGVSERQVSVLRARGWLPAPIELGPRLLRWRKTEVDAAIAAMPIKREAKEPPQFARARKTAEAA